MASRREKTFFDHLTSIWTLVPALAGLSALVIGWALEDNLLWYGLAAAAGLALAGAVAVAQWLWSWKPPDPEAAQMRQQLLDALDGYARTHSRGQAAEAQVGGTSAPLQR